MKTWSKGRKEENKRKNEWKYSKRHKKLPQIICFARQWGSQPTIKGNWTDVPTKITKPIWKNKI